MEGKRKNVKYLKCISRGFYFEEVEIATGKFLQDIAVVGNSQLHFMDVSKLKFVKTSFHE